MRIQSWHVRARLGAAIALLSLLAMPAPAPVSAASPPAGKVDSAVLAQAAAGNATFWVIMAASADLSGADAIADWDARGQFVYDRLVATAGSTQSAIRSLLAARGASFEPFWITNAIRVTGSQDLVTELAARTDVGRIEADRTFSVPQPLPGTDEPVIQAVEWGLARIGAPQVWSSFGDRGEGITVANIDTGVQFDHPALVNQYRGRNADGTFDHNYNWYDPSLVCGNPSLKPCDNNSHGTHTMGTMVGDDGNPGTNQIGVAPHAKWIAAKGCESGGCSSTALLKSGEWVLAPTDLTGKNPRPSLRPQVVNNSWGGAPTDAFYRDTVRAWVAAGIFPAFSNGNSGPACGTVGAPGGYPESYGVGAFDINNGIAIFSSRGPSPFGGVKPNISAPGVNVRSSVPGNNYASFSGTSMAAPHVAGAVALLWSGAPSLKGRIADTRMLLDATAGPTSDLTCGGTSDSNNVWGHGKLDAYTLVDLGRSPMGTVKGTVTAASTSLPVPGATVRFDGPQARTVSTGADGSYSTLLKSGSYNVSVTATGFLSTSGAADVVANQTIVRNFALNPAPSVKGIVTDANDRKPVGSTVRALRLDGTEAGRATTDPTGAYLIYLDFGRFTIEASARNYASSTQSVELITATPVVRDFALATGHAAFTPGRLDLVVPAGQQRSRTVTIVNDGGADLDYDIRQAGGGAAGAISAAAAAVDANADPNAMTAEVLYPQGAPAGWAPTAAGRIIKSWTTDPLRVGWGIGQAQSRLWISDVPPPTTNHEFTVDGARTGRSWAAGWSGVWAADMAFVPSRNLMCQLAVGADNGIHCWDPDTGVVRETISGSLPWTRTSQRGLAYKPSDDTFYVGGWNEGVVYHVKGLSYPDKGAVIADCRPPDRNISGLAYNPAFDVLWEATNSPTDTIYELNPQTCAVLATLAFPASGGFRGAGLEMDITGDLWVVSQGGKSGGASTVYLVESGVPNFGNVPWFSIKPTAGKLGAGTSIDLQLSFDTTGLKPGVYTAMMVVLLNTGRQSSAIIPLSLVVPAYQVAAATGAGGPVKDSLGDTWDVDQAWEAGGWGYMDPGYTISTDQPIGGTADPSLYQQARAMPIAYRYDGLADGTYQVELRFAEIDPSIGLNERLFDVIINDTLVLPAHDMVLKVGSFAADDYTFYARPSGGRIDVRLVARDGYVDPVISAIRVTQRPDR